MNLRMAAAAAIALVDVACSSVAVPTATPTASAVPTAAEASTSATPSLAPTSERSTPATTSAASARPNVSPTAPSAAASVMSVANGEQWITYEWYVEGNDFKSVFLVRPDGSGEHVIAGNLPGEHRGPAWSPDGKRIAFVNIDAEAPDGTLWLMDADGSNAERLVDPKGECVASYWPAWSPDGHQIAFVCYRDEDDSFATIDLASGTIKRLTTVKFPDHFDNPPTWSPDGKTIAFDLQHWDPTGTFLDGSRLGTIASTGGDVTWLTELSSFTAWPDWDPTKDLIAYNTYDLGQMHEVDHPSNLWTMRSDGTDPKQITNTTNPAQVRAAQARWLPDGSGLILSCGHGNPVDDVVLCRTDPSTGVLLFDGLPHGARPDMRPTP